MRGSLSRLRQDVIDCRLDVSVSQGRIAAPGGHRPLAVDGRCIECIHPLRQARSPDHAVTRSRSTGYALVMAEGAGLPVDLPTGVGISRR